MSKFQIPIIPATTQRCIRFPNDLVEKVENIIEGKDTTFTAFIVSATRHAIEELEEDDI